MSAVMHKSRKKIFKVLCSWLLILSLCIGSINGVNATERSTKEASTQMAQTTEIKNTTQTAQTTETKNTTEYRSKEEDTKKENKTTQAPEKLEVKTLESSIKRSISSGEAPITDRVSYVDVNGAAIVGAPTTIALGTILEHQELSITGKHYEFQNAKVNGKDCVYIGKYEDTLYYSTDGKIAIKLEDGQKLIMTYQEYYNITIKEDIPENGVAGTIIHDGKNVEASSVIRVNAGNDWKFTVKPAQANKIRYKIASVESEKNNTITKNSGDEYGATYTAQLQKDDVITIAYAGAGVYRVNVKETDNDGVTCINTDKTHYSGTYINDFTFTESDLGGTDKNTITLPIFHTIRDKRIISFKLNGTTLKVDNSDREVPWEKGNPVTVRYAPDPDTVFNIQINIVDHHTLITGNEKNCSYEYQLTIEKEKGEWRDFNFTPTYYDTGHQALSLRLLSTVNGTLQRSEAGMDVVVWDSDNQTLVKAHDNDTYNMDTTSGSTRKQVKFFFAKAKPGYRINISKSGCVRPYGKTTASDDFGKAVMTANLTEAVKNGATSTNFDNNWQQAKAAALAQGYIACVVISGESGYFNEGLGEWELYGAQFVAEADNYYVLYDKGNLPEGAVVSDMPESPDMTTSSNKLNSNPYTDAPVYGPRSFETTFQVGENCKGPKCEGYKFVGWKLMDKNDKSGSTYQNNDLFTIASDNVSYANIDFCVPNSAGALNGYSNCAYRFVAQWEKIRTKNVKVNHYLKVPDGTEVLKKTTEGTITFANNNETVTAFAKPEVPGTFPGYIFDKDDSRNTLEKTVTNDTSTDTIELSLYYKPTVLTVSKIVSGYNLEPDKTFSFTLQANAPDGDTATLGSEQVYIKKGSKTAEKLDFTNNQSDFTLKKDESVEINCLPTGWSYNVIETDPGINFTTSYTINDGMMLTGRTASVTMGISGVERVQFTNTSTIAPPETGRDISDKSWLPMFFGAIMISILGCGLILKKRR